MICGAAVAAPPSHLQRAAVALWTFPTLPYLQEAELVVVLVEEEQAFLRQAVGAGLLEEECTAVEDHAFLHQLEV